MQRAHDYIELNGFDINHYEPADVRVGNNTDKVSRKIPIKKMNYGACCYIGTVRLAAGVLPCDDWIRTDEGDGPELTLALEHLDSLVNTKTLRYPKINSDPGRLIEALGFDINNKYGETKKAFEEGDYLSEKEKAEALKIFRKALTQVHGEIENYSVVK